MMNYQSTEPYLILVLPDTRDMRTHTANKIDGRQLFIQYPTFWESGHFKCMKNVELKDQNPRDISLKVIEEEWVVL